MRQSSLDLPANSLNNSFDNNDLPPISVFPLDGNSWRIDWFGDFAFPNRMIRRKQPSVLIHLSRVLDTSFRENPAVLLSPDSTFASKQRKVWISVGTLPRLAIGDIWRDGQLELQPDYELEHFSNIEINSASAVLIKAGLNLEEQGFLLPRAEHPWHMQCTQSYCLMVELPHNRRLIIPCIELVRFYFGASSNMLTKLFLPPLTRDALYSNAQFDEATGRLTLELAPKISGASAADIGRLHMDPVAWRAAAHVGASLLKKSVANQGIYPQAYFPFEGKTNLTASGKWLPFGEEPRSTFIVYSLRSCSHAFPFRSLRYDIKDSSSPAWRKQSAPHASLGAQPRKSARNSPNQRIVESDPSSKLTPQARPIGSKRRFPDLTNKPIWKNRVLAAPADGTVPVGHSSDEVQHAAVGESGSNRRIRPIDLQIRISQETDLPAPNFLQEIVDELNALEDLNVELLTASDHDGWTIPVTTLANEDGEFDTNLFVQVGENQLRERRVAVFLVAQGPERVAIVVIESEPAHMKIYLPPDGDSVEDLWAMLRCAAADFVSRQEPKSENTARLVRWIFDLQNAG